VNLNYLPGPVNPWRAESERRHYFIMISAINIKYSPIFKKDTFKQHPELFDRFFHNAAGITLEMLQKSRASLAGGEEIETWPLITGPGFYGATHPGANNILVETMYSGDRYIYNSDCLYINPRNKIIAVADPPGKTLSSRKLLLELDRCLKEQPPESLETIINDISRSRRYDDAAALSLVHFPELPQDGGQMEAEAYVSGDILFYHGNQPNMTLQSVKGNPQPIGTTHAEFKPQKVRIDKGDFLLLASDGVDAVLAGNRDETVEQVLLTLLNEGDPEKFIQALIQRCNEYYVYYYDAATAIPRLGGDDNISILIVYPEKLRETNDSRSYLLGGFLPHAAG